MVVKRQKISSRSASGAATALMLLVLYVPPARAVSITFIDPGALDFRFQSMTDVLIAGTTYDIAFIHGVSFNALPAPQITFPTQATATVALGAVVAAINGLLLDVTTNTHTNQLLLPVETINMDTTIAHIFSNLLVINPAIYSAPSGLSFPSASVARPPNAAWLIFDQVPEPSTLLLLGLALAGLSFIGRRKEGKAHGAWRKG